MNAKRDLISSVALLVLAGLYYASTLRPLSGRPAADPLGEYGVPRFLALGITAGALWVGVGALRELSRARGGQVRTGGGAAGEVRSSRAEQFRPVALWGLLGSYALSLPWLGYLVATALFGAAALLVAGASRPRTAVVVALCLTATLFVAFAYGLGVRLPAGLL